MKYNICRYVETEGSLCEESQSVWRRSSVPLLTNSDDDHRYIYDIIPMHSIALQWSINLYQRTQLGTGTDNDKNAHQ